jgi:hypothetical protein
MYSPSTVGLDRPEGVSVLTPSFDGPRNWHNVWDLR